MTDPTPAPDLAAPKPHTAKFTGQYYRDLANGTKGVDSETFEDALNHAAYLADLAAASRPAPPVADGEVERAIGALRNRAKQLGLHFDAMLLEKTAALLLSLSSRLAAAEARAQVKPPSVDYWRKECARGVQESAALTAQAAALEEAEGVLKDAQATIDTLTKMAREAHDALDGLGCHHTPAGWVKPCAPCDEFTGKYGYEPRSCGTCNGARWVPIITAPAKGEGET